MNNILITKEKKPCIICGKLTDKLDWNYETYFCSDDCLKIMDKKLIKAELEGEEI